MAFSTAKSATSGGRVLMCGASPEPVKCVCFIMHFGEVCIHDNDSDDIFVNPVRCTTSSSAGSVRWGLTPTEWSPSSARSTCAVAYNVLTLF